MGEEAPPTQALGKGNTPNTEPTVAPTRFGHVVLKRALGRGGMGEVHLGFHEGLQKEVAVKLLPELLQGGELTERFLREARVAALLDHPSIVRVLDVGKENGRIYMVLEYVEGQDLEAYARAQGGALDVPEALRLVGQAARGLAYAHGQGVVHRDIKPANLIRRASDGHVKVLDFGLARAEGMSQLTAADQVMGTLPFMSPEHLQGKPGAASDVYSLGVTLYRLLTGRLPASGMLADLLKFHTEGVVTPVSSFRAVPEGVEALVRGSLAKRVEDRLTAAALADGIDAQLAAMGVSPTEDVAVANVARELLADSAPGARVGPSWRRWAAGGVLVAAMGLVAWRVWPEAREWPVGIADPGPELAFVDGEAAILVNPRPALRGLDGRVAVPVPVAASASKEVVLAGQGVRFAFRSERAVHVYVFNVDASGSVACVFPDYFEQLFAEDKKAGLVVGDPPRNPIAPRDGEVLVPPVVDTPTGPSLWWLKFDESKGTEWFLLAMSSTPIAELEAARSRIRAGACTPAELKSWAASAASQPVEASWKPLDLRLFQECNEKALGGGWIPRRGPGCLVWTVELDHK